MLLMQEIGNVVACKDAIFNVWLGVPLRDGVFRQIGNFILDKIMKLQEGDGQQWSHAWPTVYN